MTDCASPTAPTPVSTLDGLNPVNSWVFSSAASSAAPRSGLVSTYSGMTSRSSPGNTTRCTTRRLLAWLSVTSLPQVAEWLMASEEWAQPVLVHAECRPDRHVHVKVLVRAEAPAEQHAGFMVGHLPVGQQPVPVRRRVDRVVGLVAAARETLELPHDHCLVLRVPVTLGMEVPELMDAGERDIGVRVVHDGRALEVPLGEDLELEVEGTPAQVPGGVIEVGVERAGVHHQHAARRVRPQLREIGVQPDLDVPVIGHALQ